MYRPAFWSRVQFTSLRPGRVGPVEAVEDSPHATESMSAAPAPTLVNDAALAWMLATEITCQLDAADRTTIFLLLGCGENYEAIARMLKVVQTSDAALSNDVMTELSRWRRGYTGSDDEAVLRDLMSWEPA